MRNEKLKPITLLNELKEVKLELKRLSTIIEDRLIGLEEPTKEDIRAIKEFEKKKKEGKLNLIPLTKLK